jgi:ankyrin repeat protein
MGADSKSTEYDTPENIIVAAEHGRLDLVTVLLEGGADPNTVDDIGTSALHNAAKGGHWHIARLLLEKNASPRLQDGNRVTPLRFAVRAGHSQIVRLFLECDPPTEDNITEMETDKLIRLAAFLGNIEIVQLFLDCNTPTLEGGMETALHLAATKGHHDICDLLLKHDKALNRPLWDRIVGPSLEVYAKDYEGNTPFALAVDKGHERVVEVFLRHYPDQSKTFDRHKKLHFHRAIRKMNIEMIRVFLSCGTDIEMKDNQGRRALHEAVLAHDLQYHIARGKEMIKFLLANGASVDVKDKYGETPEGYTGDPKIRMLLRNHANMNSKGHQLPKNPVSAAPPPEYKA